MYRARVGIERREFGGPCALAAPFEQPPEERQRRQHCQHGPPALPPRQDAWKEIPRRLGFVHRAVTGQHGLHEHAGVVERHLETGRAVAHGRLFQSDRKHADIPGRQCVLGPLGPATGAHRFLRHLGGLATDHIRRGIIYGGPVDARAFGYDDGHDQGERIAHLDGIGAHEKAGFYAGSYRRREHAG